MWSSYGYNSNEGNEFSIPISPLFTNHSNERNEIPIPVSPFFTDQVFESRDELMEWVQNTAFSLGYVIVTKRSKTNENGVVSYITLKCDRGGEYKFKETTKNTGTKKINCKFELAGSYRKQYGGWILRVVCDEHNHPPAQHMEGHAYVRRLKKNEKQLLADLTTQNVAPRDILSIMKERDKNNVSTLKTIYNERQKLRSSQNVGETPVQALMLLLNEKQFITEYTVNDISNELENLFFVHPRSLDVWRAFPHMLIIDATYKTNKYNMPFVQIVGATSTNKTFSIAFAFIINEKEESYNWALSCLKSTLDNCMHPRVIVTDRELALMNACQRVFPDAARLLCRWHISENIKRHCIQSMDSLVEWESFRAMWTILVDSPTWISYNKNYEKIRSMLSKYPRVLSYVDQVWLSKYKEMFVSVWIDQHLNFGERTTNRVESQHAKLKKYLSPKGSSLDKFVLSIDRFVSSQLTAIYDSFEKSIIIRKHEHNLLCFQLLRGSVSLEALDILVGEIQRLYAHQIDSSNCGCKLRHSCGLPCACMLSSYLSSGECIPLDSIDVFWRKLDLSPSFSVENEDICCEGELEMFRENFTKQSKPVKKSMLRKLIDLVRPGKTLTKEPAVQKKTRGRPSLKKQQQKRVDSMNQAPRRSKSVRFDLVESYEEPARHSSYIPEEFPDLNEEPQSCFVLDPMESNEEPTRQSSNIPDFPDLNEEPQLCYTHPLMNEIPNLFHPYISRIQDVEGDGNCGFRALCVCLGYDENEWLNMRQQLLHELRSNHDAYATVFGGNDELYTSLSFFQRDIDAPREHWMIMPLTGFLIANMFGVIVTVLTKRSSTTIFPLWKGPEEFLYHQMITISHVYNVHYVMVQLEGDFPMPAISGYWTRHRSIYAAGWETMYMSRLEHYRQLNPPTPSGPVMTLADY